MIEIKEEYPAKGMSLPELQKLFLEESTSDALFLSKFSFVASSAAILFSAVAVLFAFKF